MHVVFLFCDVSEYEEKSRLPTPTQFSAVDCWSFFVITFEGCDIEIAADVSCQRFDYGQGLYSTILK